MNFKVGKKYLCRNGEVVTIVEIGSLITTEPAGRYDDNNRECCYYLDGTISAKKEQSWDIISEYIEPNFDGTSDYLETTSSTNEVRGNGGSTSYYDLPIGATDLGHLIKHKKMEHGIGEAFCALYRLNDNGEYKRNLTKAKYYIEAELKWLDEEHIRIRK